MRIAITGATGQLGRLVVEGLKEKVAANEIVALARSPEKAADLGVETRLADYERPETLEPALQGVDTLLLISASEVGKRAEQHHRVIEAAKAAGVERIVYTSLLHADDSPLTSFGSEHQTTEEELKESGIRLTILRNGWYSENYTASIGGAIAGGAFLGSAGEGRISGATRADYAAAAVEVLTSEGHDGKTYELAGDDAWTLSDLAAELSRQTGKTIPYRDLEEAEYAATLEGLGLPAETAGWIAGLDTGVRHDGLYNDSRELSRLIGRPTTPLADAVSEALAQLD